MIKTSRFTILNIDNIDNINTITNINNPNKKIELKKEEAFNSNKCCIIS
jgi:hypothetical protein